MVVAVGTVSTRGWAITPKDKIRELMNNYTESGQSQSIVYRGNIRSMAAAQADHSQNPDALAETVQSDLLALYGNVFGADNVKCNVDWTWVEDSDVRYKLIIELKVTENGSDYDAAQYVYTVNGDATS